MRTYSLIPRRHAPRRSREGRVCYGIDIVQCRLVCNIYGYGYAFFRCTWQGQLSSSDTLCVLVSGSARWWLSMLLADSDMFPAASQAVIRLLVHFKKKKFMVSSDKRLDNRRSLDK